jgi:hypothetical protein
VIRSGVGSCLHIALEIDFIIEYSGQRLLYTEHKMVARLKKKTHLSMMGVSMFQVQRTTPTV